MELCEQQMEEVRDRERNIFQVVTGGYILNLGLQVRGRREVEITQLDGKLQASLLDADADADADDVNDKAEFAIADHEKGFKKCEIIV